MKIHIKRQLDNPGHTNWNIADHPEWLVLELILDMMIRPIQIKIAYEMINPKS